MAALDPSKSLKYVAEQVDQVSGLIGDLTDAQWNQPSNCQGWKLADVAAHVVRNGESVLYAALFAAFSAIRSCLTPEQLARPARHASGVRPVAWFANNRLSELSFHGWDLRTSLGQRGPLDSALGEHVLNFMLDPERPIPSSLRSKELAERRILLRASSGTSWLLRTSGQGWGLESGGWLALAVYGRARISEPAFKVSGEADAAEYFGAAFGEPSNISA